MTQTQVWPTLRAHDARAMIDFLVAAFGFEEVVAYTGDDGTITHAELAWPEGGGVMLGSMRDDDWTFRSGSFGAYIVTATPDAIHDRAAAAGAKILRAPFDTDYGSRDFSAHDPEGNFWSFGTYGGHAR